MDSPSAPGPLHYVNIGTGGKFSSSGEWTSDPAHVAAIIDHLRTSSTKRVVIHVHGGLVKESAGMQGAANILPKYQQVDCHPIFLVWETGLLEVLWSNLASIHKTRLFQYLLKIVLRYALKQTNLDFGAKGPGQLPDEQEVEEQLKKEVPFQTMDAQLDAGEVQATVDLASLEDELYMDIQLDLQSDPEFQKLLVDEQAHPETELLDGEKLFPDEEGAKGLTLVVKAAATAAKIGYRVVKRVVTDRHHGYYCTVVEEILRELYLADMAEWVWSGMKRAAADMWRSNHGLSGEDLHAGTYLWEQLAALQRETPELTVDVAGHSAGAIVICEMFAAAAAGNAAPGVRNVFFLAPACTTELMVEQIVRPTDGRFERFMMYTMLDEDERNDDLLADYYLPGVYPRSLLYFVSGVAESEADEPLAGMHRFQVATQRNDAEPELAELREFLTGDVQRVAYSGQDTRPGFQTGAFAHGDFDDDDLTLASLRYFIAGDGGRDEDSST